MLALLWVTHQGGVARSQESPDEAARFHFKAGKSYYDTGDYELALREFKRSYELSQRPQLHYNISVAYEKLGNLQEAIAALERYLAEAPDIANRRTLELRLENMKKRLEKKKADAEAPGAAPVPVPSPREEQAAIQPEAEGATDLQQPVDEAGAQEPLSSPEQPAAEEAKPSGDEPQPAADQEAEGPTGEPGPPEEPLDEAPTEGLPTGSLIAFIAAGVGAAAFVGFGTAAMLKDSALSEDCLDDSGRGICDSDEVSGLTTLAVLADLGLAVAVAGGVLGAVLLLTGGEQGEVRAQTGGAGEAAPRRVAFVPWLGPSQLGAAGRVEF